MVAIGQAFEMLVFSNQTLVISLARAAIS